MPPKRGMTPKRGPGRPAKNSGKDQKVSKTPLKSLTGQRKTKAVSSKATVVKNSLKTSTCPECKESFSSVVLFKKHQHSCGTQEKLKVSIYSFNIFNVFSSFSFHPLLFVKHQNQLNEKLHLTM